MTHEAAHVSTRAACTAAACDRKWVDPATGCALPLTTLVRRQAAAAGQPGGGGAGAGRAGRRVPRGGGLHAARHAARLLPSSRRRYLLGLPGRGAPCRLAAACLVLLPGPLRCDAGHSQGALLAPCISCCLCLLPAQEQRLPEIAMQSLHALAAMAAQALRRACRAGLRLLRAGRRRRMHREGRALRGGRVQRCGLPVAAHAADHRLCAVVPGRFLAGPGTGAVGRQFRDLPAAGAGAAHALLKAVVPMLACAKLLH